MSGAKTVPVNYNPFLKDPNSDPSLVRAASLGRNGDSLLVHTTPGDIVIPVERVDQATTTLLSNLLGKDYDKFTVGTQSNSFNPATGLREFADSNGGDNGGGGGGDNGSGGNGDNNNADTGSNTGATDPTGNSGSGGIGTGTDAGTGPTGTVGADGVSAASGGGSNGQGVGQGGLGTGTDLGGSGLAGNPNAVTGDAGASDYTANAPPSVDPLAGWSNPAPVDDTGVPVSQPFQQPAYDPTIVAPDPTAPGTVNTTDLTAPDPVTGELPTPPDPVTGEPVPDAPPAINTGSNFINGIINNFINNPVSTVVNSVVGLINPVAGMINTGINLGNKVFGTDLPTAGSLAQYGANYLADHGTTDFGADITGGGAIGGNAGGGNDTGQGGDGGGGGNNISVEQPQGPGNPYDPNNLIKKNVPVPTPAPAPQPNAPGIINPVHSLNDFINSDQVDPNAWFNQKWV